MEIDNSKLYTTIFNCLQVEDEEFKSLTSNGLFYAPELYLAVCMGKAIKKNQIEIFGKELDWVRERNFGNGGPTDFAFILKKDKEEEELVAAFEVKLRSTIQAYKADIEKLQRLEPDKKKYFIALVDTFEKDQFNDLRIKTLEKDFPTLKRIAPFKNFPTKQDWYSTPVCCSVCVWEVQ